MKEPRRQARTEAALGRLRESIVVGRYSTGDMLPGERDLAAAVDVSRTTLRRMIADLVDEGLLRHRQGVGTFVHRPAVQEAHDDPRAAPARLPGCAEVLRARGVVATTREVSRAMVLPTPEEAMMLACSPDQPVVRLIRLRMDGTQVLALERATVPCRYIDAPEAIGASLYQTLEDRGYPPVRALQRLQAVTLGEGDATLLGVPCGSAGIVVRRTAYLPGGACCEFTRSTHSAGLFDAVTESFAPTAEVRPPLPAGRAG